MAILLVGRDAFHVPNPLKHNPRPMRSATTIGRDPISESFFQGTPRRALADRSRHDDPAGFPFRNGENRRRSPQGRCDRSPTNSVDFLDFARPAPVGRTTFHGSVAISANDEHLLSRAREGDRDALGELLDRHRPYLRMLALRGLDGQLAARVSASDLVQQTMLSAVRQFDRFAGTSPGEFVNWLRAIHEGNLVDTLRAHVGAARRAVGNEVPLDAIGSRADGDSRTASRRAMQGEDAVRLARAIDELPEDQAEAVRLRHLEGWSLAAIATHMSRTETAAAGLVKRAVAKLRERLR
jgi:RNA polymerase sigma-70 factor, ECF subfamily